LWKALTDTGRVLVDVSRLRLTWAPAVQVFPWVLARMGGWPAARLVLFGAGPELTTSLNALRVTATVPLAPDETVGRLLLDRRPPIVVRTVELEQAWSSPRRARLFVRAACAEWQLEMIRDDAVAVASELVANAVLHAGTACRLALRCRERGLTIAVYDRNPDRLLPLRTVAEGRQGHGLFLVAALSLHWAVHASGQEKCVWAFLPVAASDTYPHSVRRAAHDAVGEALAHGANSADAATAGRPLTTWLAEQHGPGVAGDMSDALVAELAEARATIMTADDGD
jgi:anti-sigma regulatory factor (Ser/Thr protein kinase)